MSTVRIGMINDLGPMFADGSPLLKLFTDAYELAFSEAQEDGLLDRPVELIIENVEGLPTGNVRAVIEGWKNLAEQGVVAVMGPFVSENIIDLRDYVEESGHVPTVGWPGTDKQYGEWMFGVTNGSLSEEPYLMANYLANIGKTEVGVIYEDSAIGHEYLSFLHDAFKFEGLRIAHEAPISQIETNLAPAVEAVRASGAEAIAYLGFGLPAVRINDALRVSGWDPIRIMNTAFLTAPFMPEGMRSLKGWAGVDQYDEQNPIGQGVIDRFEKRFGYRPANCIPLVAYDVANVLSHAIAYGHPLSPAGVKRGLERVKMLPAATGGAGTLLSFAPYVRRAWLGPDYLVVRQAMTDENVTVFEDMQTRLIHRFTPRSREERTATRNR
jgi:branched-chain amino acid transport system substrate-binding protein